MPVIFVSANKRSVGGLPEALQDLHTPEHKELKRLAGGHDAIGTWEDGGEGTVVAEGSNEKAKELGTLFGQKTVLTFQHHPDGPHSMYIIHHSKPAPDLVDIDAGLALSGIGFRTTLADRSKSLIVDTDGDLGPKVAAAANKLGAGKVDMLKGRADFIETKTGEGSSPAR